MLKALPESASLHTSGGPGAKYAMWLRGCVVEDSAFNIHLIEGFSFSAFPELAHSVSSLEEVTKL